MNKFTGGRMFVDESRADEYEALGHSRASSVIANVEASEVVEKKPVRRKKKVEE